MADQSLAVFVYWSFGSNATRALAGSDIHLSPLKAGLGRVALSALSKMSQPLEVIKTLWDALLVASDTFGRLEERFWHSGTLWGCYTPSARRPPSEPSTTPHAAA